MVALISPQPGIINQPRFRPAPHQNQYGPAQHGLHRPARSGARHLHAVPAFGELPEIALPEIALPEIALPEIALPEIALPDFELGRRLAAAVPPLRPMLLWLDDVVDLLRWGGSAAVRFAILAIALCVAVVSVRLSQGVPPADVSTPFTPTGVQVSPTSGGSAAANGDVVLSFSTTG